MSVDVLLSRLDKVRRTGAGKWQARCPAHDDMTPSLSIRELDDGRILLHDFAGCSAEEVLSAISLKFDVLFPERSPAAYGYRPKHRPFLPADAFISLIHEAKIVWLIGCDLHKQRTVSEADYLRLEKSLSQLEKIGAVYGQ